MSLNFQSQKPATSLCVWARIGCPFKDRTTQGRPNRQRGAIVLLYALMRSLRAAGFALLCSESLGENVSNVVQHRFDTIGRAWGIEVGLDF